MFYLPNEVLSVITNFLSNDDITDLMLLSRNFNALVTPRLKNINQEMSARNLSIESFMPKPVETDNEWISQLDLKRFEPIGFKAKKQMKEFFEKVDDDDDFLKCLRKAGDQNASLDRFKKIMSLERFNDPTFLRVLCTLISIPEFRVEYNVTWSLTSYIHFLCKQRLENRYSQTFRDVKRIWSFYNRYY
ncbi:hypothetical protein DdX_14671 [Ditylenchus destructor]|uniref:F-box domain-containing protein n=1 Tax=Ditylenchus destructor TaxID=166010 RepID=A0AAD4MTU7_9BILA|nr:hypothetical protein DdX_14671 [Ditylenchus destructor]